MRSSLKLCVFPLVVLLATQALAIEPALSARRQDEAMALQLYVSPTYKFILTWSGDLWQLEDATNDGDSEHIAFGGAAGSVTFDALADYGGDPDQCLEAAVDELSRRDGVEEVRQAEDERGGGAVGHKTAWLASGTYIVQQDSGFTGWTIECRVLIKSAAVLRTTYVAPIDQYNVTIYQAAALLEAISLPRAAFQLVGSGRPGELEPQNPSAGCTPFPGQPAILFRDAAADQEIGMITIVAIAEAPEGGVELLVSFENTGSDPLTVDAFAFYLRNLENGDHLPVSAAWLVGIEDNTRPVQTLAPDTVAVARFVFDLEDIPQGMDDRGVYAAEQDRLVELGGGAVGCGGGRPRIKVDA